MNPAKLPHDNPPFSIEDFDNPQDYYTELAMHQQEIACEEQERVRLRVEQERAEQEAEYTRQREEEAARAEQGKRHRAEQKAALERLMLREAAEKSRTSEKKWLIPAEVAEGINIIVGEDADEYVSALFPEDLLIVGGHGAEEHRIGLFPHDDSWSTWAKSAPRYRVLYFPDLLSRPEWSSAASRIGETLRELLSGAHKVGASAVIVRVPRLNGTLKSHAAHIIDHSKVDRRFAVRGGVDSWLRGLFPPSGVLPEADIWAAAAEAGMNFRTVQNVLATWERYGQSRRVKMVELTQGGRTL